MTAKDIMTEYAYVVTPSDSVTHAAALMRDSDVGFLPVVDDRETRRLVGVITDRDITVRHVADAHSDECRVGQHMSADDLATTRPDADLSEVHDLMARHQVRRVLVTDGDGHILGVIAQADVAVKEQKPREAGDVVARISEPAKPSR